MANPRAGARFLFCVLAIFLMTGFLRAQEYEYYQTEFLKKKGAKLYLGKQEFREIGFNFYQAFRLYLDKGWDYPKGQGRKFSKQTLETLAKHNFHIIRVMGQFYPPEFYETFFDENPKIQAEKRREYLKALDDFLDDCDRLDIWVVFSLNWSLQNLADLGHHTLHEGMTNPESPGYEKVAEYMRIVIWHCRTQRNIIWEIGNEYNLAADLKSIHGPPHDWSALGVLLDSPKGIGSVYRGTKNNFTSYELAKYFWRVSELIKSTDKRHLIVTGNAEPPSNAMQRLYAATRGEWVSKKMDTSEEHEVSLALVNSGADLLASHLYINEQIGAEWYQQVARQLGKPLFMGEVGPHFEHVKDKYIHANYADPVVVADVERKSEDLVRASVPISLWWTYDCTEGDPIFKLCYGKTDEALNIIEASNKKIKGRHK